ncbi:hypothetical protein [Chitinophaga sancti]|uniref:Uncharacterized protein n=1 Tax=Chitinophaga sancti TaxID=1004 RepID=A0A1K1NH14_9BACT|nr:hypothetical protein [Chitinophaga sancti]WQD63284.1 hypothetical protein U0033_02675 [Chitinophaga sancti]WQG91090.1 hypothetical protein SR876_06240 [Chitinophaga sancti]SFW33694.1 hypothetical protein SAMN05661012_01246 [Chitinophaga sancti]
MSKKTKDGVKQSIQELAMGNFRSYPEEFNEVSGEIKEHVQSLANGYWDSRDDKEIQHDEHLGIRLEDYQAWTLEAFETFVKHEHMVN